jgi:hypothetical protein
MILIFGLSVALQVTDKQIDITASLRKGADRLLSLPASVWFLIGFLIVYILLFLSPVFLNADRRMVYFNRFLPDKYPIGFDMNFTLQYVKSWVTTKQSPYPASHYPPLAYVLLSPLSLLEYPLSYTVVSFLTLSSYCILTLVIPVLFNSKKGGSIVTLLSVTGLFSYGFLFELERGQYYSIAFLLCMLAIYLFHRHHEFRHLAYVLFSFSVHLKIAPIFLLPMFVKDWRDWRGNLIRMIGLGIFNFALLFVLGYRNLIEFVQAIRLRVDVPTFVWNGNHSLSNFVFTFVKTGYGLFSETTALVLQQHENLLEKTLLVIIALSVLAIIFSMFRNDERGLNPYLLLVCTICALVIPASIDYTLPILIAPMAILLSGMPGLKGSSGNKIVSIILLLVASISYASLLYPFKYKPYILNNNFPALFLILVVVDLYYLLQGKDTTVTLGQAGDAGQVEELQ